MFNIYVFQPHCNTLIYFPFWWRNSSIRRAGWTLIWWSFKVGQYFAIFRRIAIYLIFELFPLVFLMPEFAVLNLVIFLWFASLVNLISWISNTVQLPICRMFLLWWYFLFIGCRLTNNPDPILNYLICFESLSLNLMMSFSWIH